MGTTIQKHVVASVGLSTTGELLTGPSSVDRLRISSNESDGTKLVFIEQGAFVDGGTVPAARVEAFTVASLPVEVEIAQWPCKLFGDSSFNIAVLAR